MRPAAALTAGPHPRGLPKKGLCSSYTLNMGGWLDWIAAFGTVAAVGVAWLVHNDAKRTQRLLVRPFLSFQTFFVDIGQFRIELFNAGQGVGVITSWKVLVNGTEFPRLAGQTEPDFWKAIIHSVGESPSVPTILEANSLVGESVLASNQRLIIASVQFPAGASTAYLLRLRDSIEVCVSYRSPFGERWETCSQH